MQLLKGLDLRAAAAVHQLPVISNVDPWTFFDDRSRWAREHRLLRLAGVREESRRQRGDDRQARGRRVGARARGRRAPTRSSSTPARSSTRRRPSRPRRSSSTPSASATGQQLIVAGCLSQRFGDELHALIPEIDGVIGTGAYASIVELLDDARAGKKPVRLGFEAEPEHDFLPRLITTPSRDRVSEDRRRLRSPVHVLHHPASCAARFARAARSRFSRKRARSRPAAPKS